MYCKTKVKQTYNNDEMDIFNVLHNIYLHTINKKSTKIQYQL